ncbi:MAG: zinc metallopeptidase [Candidatus Omnitrophota bacterium]
MEFILMIFIILIMAIASKNVQATFRRFSEVPIRRRITGAQAARYILDSNGLQNIPIERIAGALTDHYDSRSKILRLSEPVYNSASISAVGVAAHEAGHALQDKSGYFALQLRQGFYPIASVGSNLGMGLIFIGLFAATLFQLGATGFTIALIGLVLYACAVLFTIITLPVEFNASRRALACLTEYGIVNEEENAGTRKVLNAAALTYVAAAVGSILTLLYYAMIIFGNRD